MAKLKVDWTSNAKIELSQILDYIDEKWTERELKNFAVLLEKNISIIVSFPSIFPVSSQNTSVRRCVISKQTSLYYKIEEDRIIILSLFDNRQNPNKLVKKIVK